MGKQTLNRTHMAQYLKDEVGLSQKEARSIVDEFFAAICEALGRGDHISLPGLGKFVPVDRVSRPGRNPRTGEYHQVPARRTVVFRTGSRLKRRLAGLPSKA